MYLKATGCIESNGTVPIDPARLKALRREYGLSVRTPRFNQILLGAITDMFQRYSMTAKDLKPETGLIVGSMLGSQGMISAFQDDLLDYPEDQVMAGPFSSSVHNAPAGAMSVLFDIRGPGFSVMGFERLWDETFQLADLQLQMGTCPEILVLIGEERTLVGEAMRPFFPALLNESTYAFLFSAEGNGAEFNGLNTAGPGDLFRRLTRGR